MFKSTFLFRRTWTATNLRRDVRLKFVSLFCSLSEDVTVKELSMSRLPRKGYHEIKVAYFLCDTIYIDKLCTYLVKY